MTLNPKTYVIIYDGDGYEDETEDLFWSFDKYGWVPREHADVFSEEQKAKLGGRTGRTPPDGCWCENKEIEK